MEVSDVRFVISQWSPQDLKQADVALLEDINPPDDLSEDHTRIYSASFQPRSLEKASISIDVLRPKSRDEDSYLSVHIDTYGRRAQRLGKWTGKPEVVVGAWSPRNAVALKVLLNAAAEGKAFVMTRSLGAWMYSAELLLPHSVYDSVPELLSPYYGRKRAAEPFLRRRLWHSRIDRFEPWTTLLA